MKILRAYLTKNWFESGSANLEVGRSSPPAGAQGEAFAEKRQKPSKEIIDCYSSKPVGRLCWLSLAFGFHNLEACTGLDFALLCRPLMALEPHQFNGLLLN